MSRPRRALSALTTALVGATALVAIAPTAASAGSGAIDQQRAKHLLERRTDTAAPKATTAPRRSAADVSPASPGTAAADRPCLVTQADGLADRLRVTWAGDADQPTISSIRIYRAFDYTTLGSVVATVSGSAQFWDDHALPQSWDHGTYLAQAVYTDGTRSSTSNCLRFGGARAEDVVLSMSGVDPSAPSLVQMPGDQPSSNVVPTATSGLVTGAGYSPDGARIVYVTAADAAADTTLWLRRADGIGAASPLLTTADDLASPEWSPDARTVLVTAVTWDDAGNVVGTRLLRVNAVTGSAVAVPGSGGLAVARWLPGSVEAVATDLSSDTAPLVRINTVTGARTSIAGTAGGAEPDVSPNGRTIAFTTWAGADTDPVVLHRVATGGGTPATVATSTTDGDLWSPRWSPQGDRLYWLASQTGTSGDLCNATPSGTDMYCNSASWTNLLLADGFDVRAPVTERTSDFTGDGADDVLAVDASGVMWLYPLSDGANHRFRPRIKVGTGWSGMTLVEAAGDLTGDRLPDVVARDRAGYLWLYPTRHALTTPGGWAPRRRYGGGWNAMTAVMGVGDWNGDGLADLLARTTTGDMRMYTGDGHGGLHGGTRVGHGFASWSLLEATGDLGDDGHADFVARNTKGELWLFRGAGTATGRFLPSRRIGTGWQSMTMFVGVERYRSWREIILLSRDRYGVLHEYGGVYGRLQGLPYTVGSGWNAMRVMTA